MIKIKALFKEKIHVVARNLILSNIFASTGWAFINPVFAIYVVDKIKGGNIQVVGICYFIYWITKGILQLFVSDYLDRVEGEADDYFTLILGQFLDLIVPLAFLLVKNTGELYLVFFIYGIADSLYVPPWNSIFTRYLNIKRISFEWALNSTGVNLGSALAILMGSSLALIFGFPLTFIFVALCQAISFIILLSLKKYFISKKKPYLDYYIPLKS
ncbi:MAG: MFS transporter [Minisyncoccia bacterium]|jgi:MFS family permease